MVAFPEEQLDSPAGYLPIQPGQILSNGRWSIIRKLGWGPRSTTWLALDNTVEIGCYRAIKVFTAAATQDTTGSKERDMLLGPLKNIESGVPRMKTHFYENDAAGKKHLCLAFFVLGNSVENLRLSNIYNGQYLPLHVVQKVVGDISITLANLVDNKIVHGAVTADNFLFWSVQTADDIQKIVLQRSKNAWPENILGDDGVTYPSVKSQPMSWQGCTWDSPLEDILCASIHLCNYGHVPMGGGGSLNHQKNFLPPEVLQGGKFDHKSDIWMLGCTAYLLLTGNLLFTDDYVASPHKTANDTLASLDSLLTESGKLGEKDVAPAASFLKSCLAIKPAQRASAEDIMGNGWVKVGCSCGWCG